MAKHFYKILFFCSLIISMAGCSTHELPESWRPIKYLVERGDWPGVGDTVVTTVSPNLYVKDIDQWLEDYPENSIQHEALRRHEVEHAREQEDFIAGAIGATRGAKMSLWISRYLTDKGFRLATEQRGYKAAIKYERSRGKYRPAELYASILSSSTYGSMISYEDALQWVRDVYNGKIK